MFLRQAGFRTEFVYPKLNATDMGAACKAFNVGAAAANSPVDANRHLAPPPVSPRSPLDPESLAWPGRSLACATRSALHAGPGAGGRTSSLLPAKRLVTPPTKASAPRTRQLRIQPGKPFQHLRKVHLQVSGQAIQ